MEIPNHELFAQLEAILIEWVKYQSENGIKQQTDDWARARITTVGGSSMATVQGINPYQTILDFLRERCGLAPFRSAIQMQWGNLCEDIIKQYVELDLSCNIRGEDLYVLGDAPTSYSPDGLGVISRSKIVDMIDLRNDPTGNMRDMQAYPDHEIALFEFKCPYSRIPSGYIPKYYAPQVLMGLELLKIPTVGVYAEAVIRRCTWEQLGYTPDYDKTLVKQSSGKLPLGYGIVGIYINSAVADKNAAALTEFTIKYKKFYDDFGNTANDFCCNDLGDSSPTLFTEIMAAVDQKLLSVKYLRVHRGPDCTSAIDEDLTSMSDWCRENNYKIVGVLPWKIFRVDYHIVEKQENYIDQWRPLMFAMVDVVKKCRAEPANAERYIADFAIHYNIAEKPKKY